MFLKQTVILVGCLPLSLDFNFLFALIFLIFSQTCFNCRQSGHEVADCPEVRKDVDHGAGICFKCGSTEHRLERCRVRTPNGKAMFLYLTTLFIQSDLLRLW